MALLSLPVELLVEILLNLDMETAFSCQRVNRFLRNLYHESAKLQYRIECEIASVYDNPKCTLPVNTRLRMLRDRESAWSSLQPAFSGRGFVPTSDINSVDITTGYCYVGLVSTDAAVVSWMCSRPIPTDKGELIKEEGRWDDRWSNFSMEGMVDFAACFDEYDLIACLIARPLTGSSCDLRVSLVQLSSGAPHPSTASPTFPICQVTCQPAEVTTQMEVVGENLVLAIDFPFRKLYFPNWQTGTLKSVRQCIFHLTFPLSKPPRTCPSGGYCDLVFLLHDILCQANLGDMSLNMYYIPPSSGAGAVSLIQSLSLPDDLFPSECVWIEAKGSLNPTSNGAFPKYVSPNRPFLERPEEAVIVFNFHADDPASPVTMVVHRKSLLNLLLPQEQWSKTQILTVPWAQWVPSSPAGLIHRKAQVLSAQFLTDKDTSIINHRTLSLEQETISSQEDDITLQERGSLLCTMNRSREAISYDAVFMTDTGIIALNGDDTDLDRFQLNSFDILHFG